MSFRKKHIIMRSYPGLYIKGLWQDGQTISFPIMASVQPAKMEDLVNMPEGRRLSDFIRVYTATELQPQGEGDIKQQPDTMIWHDHLYALTQMALWQNGVIPHYKCIFTKISQA